MRVGIGIPSFNEGQNLVELIRDIQGQTRDPQLEISEVIVSDDSDNGTDLLVAALAHDDPRIRLLHHPQRRGVAAALNEIFRNAVCDVLVILAADTRVGNDAISNISTPFLRDASIGIASGESLPVTRDLGASSRASIFAVGVLRMIRARHDPNLYVGRFSAFSRRMYEDAMLPPTAVCEEPFLVGRCLSLGLRIEFVPSARCRYVAPSTMKDLLRQNVRSSQGQKRFTKEEAERAGLKDADGRTLERLAARKYRLSLQLLSDFVRLALADPVNAAFWFAAKLQEWILARFYHPTPVWEISPSTKTGLTS